MPRKNGQAAPAPSDEHIFPASQLTPLAVRWKELTEQGRHKEAMFVLEEIVVGSTAMFERLAQFEDFHHTVDLRILVSAAQEKVVKWLMRWQPSRGRLFSWFSTCAKNAFRSEVVKVTQFRRRYHVTSDSLEQFYGVDDPEVDKRDVANEVKNQIHNITCGWGDPQERGAIKYLIECIVDDSEHDKQAAIRGASYAYCISPDLARFFYDWSMAAMRHALYERTYVPFTEQDLLRAAESYGWLPLFIDTVGWPAARKWLVVIDGKRTKWPSVAQIERLKANARLHREIDQGDLDPASIAEVARKHKRTERSAAEAYAQMTAITHPNRYGEHEVFGDSPLDI